MRPVRRAAVVLAAVALPLASPGAAAAQGVSAQLGRFFDGDGWTAYRLGYVHPILGPLAADFHGQVFTGPGGLGHTLWGAGADLSLFQGGRSGLYVVGGVGGGFQSGGLDGSWGSWSAGLGYDLPLGPLTVGGEARWRELSVGRRDGLELGFRLGANFGRRGAGTTRRPEASAAGATPTPALAIPFEAASADSSVGASAPAAGSAAAVRQAVTATATEALGTRYQLGGTGTGSQGFDCSGLIQYAYGRHGVSLPRISADQAKAGSAVERRVELLLPGDLLTFSNRGRRITHVGMYLGDGKFIHSATRGVQVSLLSEDDPYGKWWWKRWKGVRRIVR